MPLSGESVFDIAMSQGVSSSVLKRQRVISFEVERRTRTSEHQSTEEKEKLVSNQEGCVARSLKTNRWYPASR